jgi:hypothetical protein
MIHEPFYASHFVKGMATQGHKYSLDFMEPCDRMDFLEFGRFSCFFFEHQAGSNDPKGAFYRSILGRYKLM